MAYFTATAQLTTATISHIPSAYYKKTGLDQLLSKFMARDACMEDSIPQRNGSTVQWFRYNVLASNTTAKTTGGGTNEGIIGAGVTSGYGSATITATVSQYTDYIALSDYVRKTSIDDTLAAASKNLGYRAGLSVDKVSFTVIDAGSASFNTIGTYFGARDAAQAWFTLQSREVQPMSSGKAAGFMYGIISPLAAYDLVNDPAGGGFLDLYKYTDPEKFVKYQDRNLIATVHGVKFYMSNNVKVTAGSPNKYRTYVFGDGGLGCVSLEGTSPTSTNDVKQKPFSINVVQGGASIADPEGVIGGICSYNFTYVAKILQTSPYRYMFADAPSTIG
jgi:N4-gp56 family major capsid protein